MTTLKNLKGTAIQFLAEDPIVGGSTWSSGGNLNTARYVPGGGGTSTAGIMFAGSVGPSVNNTELYNGTSWTEVNDMASARSLGGSGTPAGTSSATLVAGSSDPGYSAATEEFTVPVTNSTITVS